MIWRIYRLPGSREHWHVDNGEGTQVFNVLGFDLKFIRAKSIDINSDKQPRAWIQISEESELYIVNGIAIWEYKQLLCAAADCQSVQHAPVAAESAEHALVPLR